MLSPTGLPGKCSTTVLTGSGAQKGGSSHCTFGVSLEKDTHRPCFLPSHPALGSRQQGTRRQVSLQGSPVTQPGAGQAFLKDQRAAGVGSAGPGSCARCCNSTVLVSLQLSGSVGWALGASTALSQQNRSQRLAPGAVPAVCQALKGQRRLGGRGPPAGRSWEGRSRAARGQAETHLSLLSSSPDKPSSRLVLWRLKVSVLRAAAPRERTENREPDTEMGHLQGL